MMPKYEDVVREVAVMLGVLDGSGNLMEMDSLSVLDFVTELEHRTSITVPTVQIRRSNFESLQAIAAMLDQLSAAA
jgi:acyl carrier protein